MRQTTIMRAQIFIGLLNVVILQFVHSGSLVHDEEIVEDETSTATVGLLLKDLNINYTEISIVKRTLQPEITTLFSDTTIETTLETETTSISPSPSTTSSTTTIIYNTTSNITSTTSPIISIGTTTQLPSTTKDTRSIIPSAVSITERSDETNKVRQNAVASTERNKKQKTYRERTTTVLPFRNPYAEYEEAYFRKNDPWSHRIFRCWLYQSCK